MSEKLWHIKQCQLFERLSAEELRRVESRSRARTFAARSPIYLPAEKADSVFVLSSGRAKICHITPEGKQSILSFIEPGELFGELAIFDQEQREEYAETISKCNVVMISREVMQQLMEDHADVSLQITKLIGLRRKRIERRLKQLLFLSNRERLTHLLLELAEQYGKTTAEGLDIGIKLSHQDLANVIGSTRETVTVVLGELQNEGLISVGRRKVVIKQPEKFAAGVHRPEPTPGEEQSEPAQPSPRPSLFRK